MCTIIVMTKAPEPGKSKTRLSPPLCPAEAARVAQAALEDTLDAVNATSAVRRVLALDGPVGAWLPSGFDVIPQHGTTLGERLSAVLEDVPAPALLIGMDTPQVTPQLLEEAQTVLLSGGTDAVLGLAADGGWWALGVRRGHPDLFANVPMSSPFTGAAQLRQLERLGLKASLLPILRDIDVWSDALEVAGEAPGSRLARIVEELGLREGVAV